MNLETIKSSLISNPNLNDDIRKKFFELVQIFNEKLPQINLTNLNNKLKNVKITRISKFEKRGVYYYDPFRNVIAFSDEIEGNYDIDNLFMKSIIEMSRNGLLTGERFKALDVSLTEMLANSLVGNDGESDLEEEIVIANLLSHIVGKDILFDSYFLNNGELVVKSLQEAEVGFNDNMVSKSFNRPSDEFLNSYNRLYQAKLTRVLDSNEFSNLIILCGDLYANKIRQGKVSEEQTDDFIAQLPSPDYFTYPHSNISRAKNTVVEGVDMALAAVSKRYSIPSQSYIR